MALIRTLAGFNFVKHIALSLGTVTTQSGLLPAAALCQDPYWALRQGAWALNGRRVVNPFFQVYRGDFIHMVASPQVVKTPRASQQ